MREGGGESGMEGEREKEKLRVLLVPDKNSQTNKSLNYNNNNVVHGLCVPEQCCHLLTHTESMLIISHDSLPVNF